MTHPSQNEAATTDGLLTEQELDQNLPKDCWPSFGAPKGRVTRLSPNGEWREISLSWDEAAARQDCLRRI
ncbi:MAG: hypothetical protein ACE5EM_13240 [Sphingomonadales bacterium]